MSTLGFFDMVGDSMGERNILDEVGEMRRHQISDEVGEGEEDDIVED